MYRKSPERAQASNFRVIALDVRIYLNYNPALDSLSMLYLTFFTFSKLNIAIWFLFVIFGDVRKLF